MRSVFSKNVIFASLLLSLSSLSSISSADFQADAGFASEYVRQGLKQSGAKPVLQGNVIYRSQTGLYGGIWGSGIERGSSDSTRFEFDGFAGFYLPLTDSIDLDLGYTYATFVGESEAANNPYGVSSNAYGETFLNILINQTTTLGYRYSSDFFGTGEDQQVIELAQLFNYSEFTFETSVRNYKFLDTTETVNWGSESRDDYFHFRIGVARSYFTNHMALSLERTNLSSNFEGGTQIVFTYARQFDF
jgi:uncharacterized protein (TIGR02001 family)